MYIFLSALRNVHLLVCCVQIRVGPPVAVFGWYPPLSYVYLCVPLSILITIDVLGDEDALLSSFPPHPRLGRSYLFLLILMFHLSSYPVCREWPSHFDSCLVSLSQWLEKSLHSLFKLAFSSFHHPHLLMVTFSSFSSLSPLSFQMIQK